MTISFNTLLMWLKALASAICPPAPPKLGDSLANIIMADSINYGPDLKTGGIIHKIVLAEAWRIADIIVAEAPKHGLEVEMVAAGIAGESRFDAHATNPNHQHSVPGETAHEALLHTDLGIGQFSGANLCAEFPTLTDAQIMALAYDATWSIPRMCAAIAKLFVDTKREMDAAPTLLDHVPNKDLRILATEAYNKGEHGATLIAEHDGNWSYGSDWIQRYESYKSILAG